MQVLAQQQQRSSSLRCARGTTQLPHGAPRAAAVARNLVRRRAVEQQQQEEGAQAQPDSNSAATAATSDLDKQLSKLTRQTASTFAPRASGKVKNPAFKGSTLYNVFEVQAWLAVAAGGLLSFNLIFPTDEPSIPRLMGMWSIWMFTIPSLRAKECTAREKDALNLLFLLVPLMNVILPFVWKSFPFIFSADVVALAGVYAWKGVWSEVYGLPLGTAVTAAAAAAGGSSDGEDGQQQ